MTKTRARVGRARSERRHEQSVIMGGVCGRSTADFLASTADLARAVIHADDGWPTYDAGMRFLGMAMEALSPTVGVPAEELSGGSTSSGVP